MINYLMVLGSISLLSCKKSPNTVNSGINNAEQNQQIESNLSANQRSLSICPVSTGVIVSNGVLSFNTVTTFTNVIKDIQFKHDSLCNGDSLDFYRVSKCFERNFTYTSLRSIIHTSNLDALNNDVYDIDNDLDNKYFPHIGIRTVCNQKREVLVAGELQVYTNYGDIFVIHNGSTSFTEDINRSIYTNLRNVTRYIQDGSEYYYDNAGTQVLKVAAKDCKNWLKINKKYYSNNKRFIRLSNFSQNSPNLVSTGSETWAYRKVGGTWVLAWVNGLNVNYGGNFQNNNCDHMAFISGANSGNNVHHRRSANDQWTSNGYALNIARKVSNGTYGGNAWHGGFSGTLNITVN